MLKFIGLIVIGISLALASLGLSYLALKSMENNGLPWQFLLSLPLAVASIFVFLKSGKMGDVVISGIAKVKNLAPTDAGASSMIQKNNDMVAQWRKVNDQKDKMHMLEIAAAAAEQKNSES